MEIATGLHRIGNDTIAAYLMIDDSGVTVIDAGLPGLRRALRRELTALGRSEADIRAVILTHADADHLGFAEAVRAEYGIPVYVGAGEEAYARREVKAQPTPKQAWRLGPALRFVAMSLPLMGRERSLREVVTAADGVVLDLPGEPQIVALPGHTAGHIAVFSAPRRTLFVGDALTTRHVLLGEDRPRDAPFSEDPERAMASLEVLRSFDVDFVLPGHGPVWQGGAGTLVDAIVASR